MTYSSVTTHVLRRWLYDESRPPIRTGFFPATRFFLGAPHIRAGPTRMEQESLVTAKTT